MRISYKFAALVLSALPAMTAATDAPAWSLHGFGDVSVRNDYVTPRGLVVTTRGTTAQVLNGLVLVSPGGIAFDGGTWTDLNPGYSKADGNISAVNEFDFFFGVSGKIARGLTAGVDYSQFISGQPSVAFHDEHNLEFSLKYADAPKFGFTINPYAKIFYAFAGRSSTVVTGKAGGTFDAELGIVPAYKMAAITLTAPSWITVGPENYWAARPFRKDGNFGVVSTGLKASTPLSFIKSAAGISVYTQAQYFHLINNNLVIAKAILNNGDHKRDQVVLGGGISFGF